MIANRPTANVDTPARLSVTTRHLFRMKPHPVLRSFKPGSHLCLCLCLCHLCYAYRTSVNQAEQVSHISLLLKRTTLFFIIFFFLLENNSHLKQELRHVTVFAS